MSGSAKSNSFPVKMAVDEDRVVGLVPTRAGSEGAGENTGVHDPGPLPHRIVRDGTGAARQRRSFERRHRVEDVVDLVGRRRCLPPGPEALLEIPFAMRGSPPVAIALSTATTSQRRQGVSAASTDDQRVFLLASVRTSVTATAAYGRQRPGARRARRVEFPETAGQHCLEARQVHHLHGSRGRDRRRSRGRHLPPSLTRRPASNVTSRCGVLRPSPALGDHRTWWLLSLRTERPPGTPRHHAHPARRHVERRRGS